MTVEAAAKPSDLSTDDPSYAIYQSGLSSYNNVQDLQDQLIQMQAKIVLISAMMATVSPMIACSYMIPLMMEMLGQAQSIQQVAIPAAQLDEQSAMLQEVTLQQSLFNQLGEGAQGYNNYECELNDSSDYQSQEVDANGNKVYDSKNNPVMVYDPTLDPNYVQGVPPMTQDQANAYQTTLVEFNNSTMLITATLTASLYPATPTSKGAGWLDPGTAETMLTNEQAISNIFTPTGGDPITAQAFAKQYSCYVANPTSPTDVNGNPVTYDSDGSIASGSPEPDSYAVAQNVQILTQSMNTNVSMMNSCSQTTTGKIKAGTSEIQQFYGSTEDAMQSSAKLRQTEVNATGKSS